MKYYFKIRNGEVNEVKNDKYIPRQVHEFLHWSDVSESKYTNSIQKANKMYLFCFFFKHFFRRIFISFDSNFAIVRSFNENVTGKVRNSCMWFVVVVFG